ncbi:hypothetical protein [Halorhabdus salina]|uniref:hypothetical protein n=1 Tax=Halorhabdus salina TaxID=2750670 RepID=UPI0015EF6FAE|nr:hypothetical protein [Halorhabdus salina]
MLLLAVGVPTAYNDYRPSDEQTWVAIVWTIGGCLLVTIGFVGSYLLFADVLDQSLLVASVGAYLVVFGSVLALLQARQRSNKPLP